MDEDRDDQPSDVADAKRVEGVEFGLNYSKGIDQVNGYGGQSEKGVATDFEQPPVTVLAFPRVVSAQFRLIYHSLSLIEPVEYRIWLKSLQMQAVVVKLRAQKLQFAEPSLTDRHFDHIKVSREDDEEVDPVGNGQHDFSDFVIIYALETSRRDLI